MGRIQKNQSNEKVRMKKIFYWREKSEVNLDTEISENQKPYLRKKL